MVLIKRDRLCHTISITVAYRYLSVIGNVAKTKNAPYNIFCGANKA